ncbi:MAG: M23 family metallopeptidase [Clostridia bacterium]|nr:M23 family metallopeptidase [Clostridia bacterium]
MSKASTAAKRFGGFIKRNALYLLILLCIASVATVIALAVTGNFGDNGTDIIADVSKGDDTPAVVEPDKPADVKPDEPVVEPEKLSFIMPTNGTISKAYNDTALVWNSTLEQYSAHIGTDFVADDLKVCAVEKGVVKEVGNDLLEGNYVVISHNDGYETRYYSLSDNIAVKVNDNVVKGQIIGEMSSSMATESLDGNHLHFEMSHNGEDINPVSVLVMNEK